MMNNFKKFHNSQGKLKLINFAFLIQNRELVKRNKSGNENISKINIGTHLDASYSIQCVLLHKTRIKVTC